MKTSIQLYLEEISRFELLSREEEKRLLLLTSNARKKGQGTAEAKAARQKVIQSNLALVVFFAKRLRLKNPKFDLEDLIGVGNLGLIRAVDKFDYERGGEVKFSTYASFWIMQFIKRHMIRNNPGTLPLKFDIAKIIPAYQEARHQITQEEENPHPDWQMVARKAKLTPELKKFARNVEAALRPVESINLEHSRHLQVPASNPSCPIAREELLDKLTVKLSPREALIIILYYGLEYPEAKLNDLAQKAGVASEIICGHYTLKKLAKLFGVVKERIRQIRETAINKLRPFVQEFS